MHGRLGAPTWAVAALLVGLGVAASVDARPQLDSSTQLRDDVAATRAAEVLTFKVVFTMAQDSQAYLKVSPRPGNPVFGNGTVNGAGWWTGVRLEGPGGTLKDGATAGDPPTDFGRLSANVTYTLWLNVHAPAGALAQWANYTLDYILAEHVVSTSSGSGGTLDESVGLHAVARVQGVAGSSAGIPLWAWIAGGVVVLVLAGAIVVAMRKRSQGPKE